MHYKTLGKIIRDMRLNSGRTQEEICANICATSTLSRIESGSQIPSRRTLKRILTRLGSISTHHEPLYAISEEITESLCTELLVSLESKDISRNDELLYAFHQIVSISESARLRQFYEMTKLIAFYQSQGIENSDYLDKCLSIYHKVSHHLNIKSPHSLPKYPTRLDTLMLNNIAAGYLFVSRPIDSIKILLHLYEYLKADNLRYIKYSKTAAILCHNIALCLCKLGQYSEAYYYTDTALSRLKHAGGYELLISALKLEQYIISQGANSIEYSSHKPRIQKDEALLKALRPDKPIYNLYDEYILTV